MSNVSPTFEQQEAQDRLMMDELPTGEQTKCVVPNAGEVIGTQNGSMFVYMDPANPGTTCYMIYHSATQSGIISYEGMQPFGLVQRAAVRLAGWLDQLDWSLTPEGEFRDGTLEVARELLQAYKLRDWIRLEKIVKVVDNPASAAYTEPVGNPNPEPSEVVTMSAVAPVNGVAQTVTQPQTAEAPRRRGRKPAEGGEGTPAKKRQGIVMRPVADFNVDTVDQLATALQERGSTLYAAGILVLATLSTEDQMEAVKRAKIAFAEKVKAENAGNSAT